MNTCTLARAIVAATRRLALPHPLPAALPWALVTAVSMPALATTPYQEVMVTATRTPVALEDSLAAITVIPRARLEQLQPADLTDLLRQVPSMDISSSGGMGSQTSLYTRGTASSHTLILVDGQRIGSATLGSTSFQYLSPDQIERIEVVRGSRSSLYGSDAIGGVVQIFTRDGSGSPGSYLSAGTGSHNLKRFAAGSSGKRDNLRYGVHASWLDTDGFDNLELDSGFNGDDDGYRNRSVNASLGYRFANEADLALHFLESNNRNEYDSAFSADTKPYSNSWIQNINLKGSLPVTDYWLSQLSLGSAVDDSDNRDAVDGSNSSNFRTTREQLFWQNDFNLAEGHLLTLGYEFYQDEVEGNTAYTETSRDNEALFAQYQLRLGRVDALAGYREDDNEAFGSHATANVSIGIAFNDQLRLLLGWSEGFKAPSFNDLYWPVGAFSAGNPDLQPEQSDNLELGLQGTMARRELRWSLTYFRNNIDNLIDWAPGPDFVWRPYNVSAAEIRGAEFTLDAELWAWQWSLGYTYVEPRDADSDKLLVKRSRNNLSLSAERQLGAVSLGLSLKTQDQRYTNSSNSQSIGGYATIGLRLGYEFSEALEASLKLENLLDRDYHLNDGYHQDGLNWTAGVTYRL